MSRDPSPEDLAHRLWDLVERYGDEHTSAAMREGARRGFAATIYQDGYRDGCASWDTSELSAGGARGAAREWLRVTLADGPLTKPEIELLAGAQPFSFRTVERAKLDLKVAGTRRWALANLAKPSRRAA